MRSSLTVDIEAKRIHPPGYERITSGPNGAFVICGPNGADLRVMASDGRRDPEAQGFEHVSVSLRHRVPNWQEMCFIKNIFWGEEETVYQLHPPKSQWINNHPNVLHLWRHANKEIPMPPNILV